MNHSFPTLSRYTIERVLGSGGMGAVYIAIHNKLGRKVALKVPHKFEDPARLKRFLREGETLAQIKHPNIVQVFDAGEEDGHAFLAMELIQGQNLEQMLKGQNITVDNVIQWAIQIADALHYIHEEQRQPILHRDIKNENIIVNEKGDAILVISV